MKLIFANGCFDILHRGHIELLEYCRSIGGRVIVGLNSDSSVKQLKGPHRPYFPQQDREYMLRSCRHVDEVVIFDEETPYETIKKLRPDIIVKGGDYTEEDVVGCDLAEVRIFKYIDGYSTTKILQDGAAEL